MTKSGARIRIHMGCGEPLKSRSWVTGSKTVLVATEEKPVVAVDVSAIPRQENQRKP